MLAKLTFNSKLNPHGGANARGEATYDRPANAHIEATLTTKLNAYGVVNVGPSHMAKPRSRRN